MGGNKQGQLFQDGVTSKHGVQSSAKQSGDECRTWSLTLGLNITIYVSKHFRKLQSLCFISRKNHVDWERSMTSDKLQKQSLKKQKKKNIGNVSGQLFRVGPSVTVWDKDQWFVLRPFCNYPEYQAWCTHGNRRGSVGGMRASRGRGSHGSLPISLVHLECMSPNFNCCYFSQPSPARFSPYLK